MIFQGATADPPIDQQPITSNGLTPFYVSSLYENNTYFTQSATGTTLEIDVSSIDVEGNPTTSLGTFSINANTNLNGNDLSGVRHLYVDNIGSATTTAVAFQNQIDMSALDIQSVGTIHLDYFTGYNGDRISALCDLDMNSYNILNCPILTANLIRPYNQTFIDFYSAMLSNIAYTYSQGSWYSIPDTSDYQLVRSVAWPDIGSGVPPFYIAYSSNATDFTPIAADWSAFPASQLVNLSYNSLAGVAAVNFFNGASIAETLYGGNNYLYLNNQTIVNGNVVISNGLENPTLTFDSGKQAYIDFYENFRFSCNVDMSNNDISNINQLATKNLSLYNVSCNVSGIVTCGSNNRIQYSINSGVTENIANVNDIITYKGNQRFTTNKTVAGVTSNILSFTMSNLSTGIYNIQYSYNGINHNNNNFTVRGVLSNTNIIFDNTDNGSSVATIYTGRSGIGVISSSGNYTFSLVVVSQTGNTVTFSNAVAIVSQLPI